MRLELSELRLKYASLRVQSRAEQARLTASIAADGQQSRVAVVAEPAPGTGYVLVDGYRRVAALRELGRDLVEAHLLAVEEAEALILTHRLERADRRSALEQGWLLQTLMDEHGVRQGDLARRLARSTSWVSRRLSLVEVLPESTQQAVRKGRVPAHAAMRSLVPLARANADDCTRLVDNLAPGSVSVRELDALYRGWHAGDPVQRERIVAEPRLFLKVQPPTPTERTPTQRFIEDLQILSRVSARASRQLSEGDVDCHRARVQRVSADMQRAVRALSEQIKEAQDARPGHAQRDPATTQTESRSEGDSPRAVAQS